MALITTRYQYILFFSIILMIIIISFLPGCGGTMVTKEMLVLKEADSLFREGNYQYALRRFDMVRTLRPKSPAAKIAQYYLGFINVYYDNPFASWEAALREFKLYATLYPNEAKIDEVNSWIKILVAMQSYKKNFGVIDSISKQPRKRSGLQRKSKTISKESIRSLNDKIRRCNHVRDSLIRKNKDLENFIIDLEAKCQDAIQ